MSYAGLINLPLGGGSTGSSIFADTVTTFTNKTVTDTTNDVTAKSLHSATTSVDVSASTAPTTGQQLTSTSGTTATWQTPSGGGGSEFTATSLKTASYTAVSGDWVLCDANAAAGNITITLPATPSVNDKVRITLAVADPTAVTPGVGVAASTPKAVLIGRNGSSIDGLTTTENEIYNICWRVGDTVTFRCHDTSKWIVSDRKIADRFVSNNRINATASITGANYIPPYLYQTYDYNQDYSNGSGEYYYTAPVTGYYQYDVYSEEAAQVGVTGDRQEVTLFVGTTFSTPVITDGVVQGVSKNGNVVNLFPDARVCGIVFMNAGDLAMGRTEVNEGGTSTYTMNTNSVFRFRLISR